MVESKRVPILMILIDGLADYQIRWAAGQKELTTLQKAETPVLDALASQDLYGVHDPVQSGLACGSDTAHMSLFGYNPLKLYQGRGVFEALGAGQEIKTGDIAFKSNFAYMNLETRIVERRRVDREFPSWGIPLCQALTGIAIPGFPDHSVEVMYATEHRCSVKVRGPRLSHKITGNDPLKDERPVVTCEAIDSANSDAVFTAELINALSVQITQKLLEHPINIERRAQGLPYANFVTLRGAGITIDEPRFNERHGLKAFMIAPTAIIRGVGITFGMDLLDDVEGMTGYYDSNLEGKMVRAAREVIENANGYQYGFVHIKAVDDAGHDKNKAIKVSQLEKIDRALQKVVNMLGEHSLASNGSVDFVLCVTGDHTTPVQYGDHTFEPVPIAIGAVSRLYHDLKQGAAPTKTFDEIECGKATSALGRFNGIETIPLLKRFRDSLIAAE